MMLKIQCRKHRGRFHHDIPILIINWSPRDISLEVKTLILLQLLITQGYRHPGICLYGNSAQICGKSTWIYDQICPVDGKFKLQVWQMLWLPNLILHTEHLTLTGRSKLILFVSRNANRWSCNLHHNEDNVHLVL